MMRSFMIVMGFVIVLGLVLAVCAGPAQAEEAPTIEQAEKLDLSPLACLPLVGGTAILAGLVWFGTLRRMMS
jgi:hypothetical protein